MGKLVIKDPVQCHAGWQYPQHPTAILWESKWYKVTSITDEYRNPVGYCFDVVRDTELWFELLFDLALDKWLVNQKAKVLEEN